MPKRTCGGKCQLRGGKWRLKWKDLAALLVNPWAGVFSAADSIRESKAKDKREAEMKKIAKIIGDQEDMPDEDDLDIDILDEIENLSNDELQAMLRDYLGTPPTTTTTTTIASPDIDTEPPAPKQTSWTPKKLSQPKPKKRQTIANVVRKWSPP